MMDFNEKTIGDMITGEPMIDGELLAGRYKIIRKLGEGGMGAVFLAEDTLLDNRRVAIKSLPLILGGNARALNQLKREAKLAMRLSHPYIVTLRSFEESAQGPFLVMDYIEGKTLEDLLGEKTRLTEDETIALFKPLAEALDYAHSQGVIHRDIKPSNIMIRNDGTPLITDFGIAREMKESLTRLTGKDTSGTLPYMSPEQLLGAPPSVAQDIYSLAATIYECLMGDPPFCRGDTHYQIIHKPVDISNTPEKFKDILLRGLHEEPTERPCSSADLVSFKLSDVTVLNITHCYKSRETGKCDAVSDQNIKDIQQKAMHLAEKSRYNKALEMLEKLYEMCPARNDIADMISTINMKKIMRQADPKLLKLAPISVLIALISIAFYSWASNLTFLLSGASVLLGAYAKKKIDKSDRLYEGRGWAIIGMVIGFLFFAGCIAGIIFELTRH